MSATISAILSPPWPEFALPDAIVLLGLSAVGILCGVVGSFATLRRQALLSDTLAHAALPGVCLAFLFTGAKELSILLAGAAATGMLGALLVTAIVRTSRLRQDVAQGIVLSTFFGAGVLLLGYLQSSRHQQGAQQSGLDRFIFGQAAFLTSDQVRLMVLGLLAVLAVVLLLFKEFKLLAFDAEYAGTIGFAPRGLDLLLGLLIVVTVMLSLRAVGVVLTVGLIVAPAAAARQWTRRLGPMLVLAAGFGALAAMGGATWSRNAEKTPTGPAAVLAASAVLGVSLLFAPERGLVGNWLRRWRHQRRAARENLLSDFYRLAERHGDKPWAAGDLAAVRGLSARQVRQALLALWLRSLIQSTKDGWTLTPAGEAEARRVVRNHRLWELFLAKRLDLAHDHVHRDAEAMEHALGPELVAELETALEHPEIDPHGHRIPTTSRAESS